MYNGMNNYLNGRVFLFSDDQSISIMNTKSGEQIHSSCNTVDGKNPAPLIW